MPISDKLQYRIPNAHYHLIEHRSKRVELKETTMQRIKIQSMVILAFFTFWIGLTVNQVAAHESATASHPKSKILNDKVIAPWYQKVQEYPRDDRIRVELGDALMQRAR